MTPEATAAAADQLAGGTRGARAGRRAASYAEACQDWGREHLGEVDDLAAVLISGGKGNAEFLGWQGPYPDVEELRDKHRAAEKRTDHLAARAFTSLYDGERRELVGLLEEARGVLSR